MSKINIITSLIKGNMPLKPMNYGEMSKYVKCSEHVDGAVRDGSSAIANYARHKGVNVAIDSPLDVYKMNGAPHSPEAEKITFVRVWDKLRGRVEDDIIVSNQLDSTLRKVNASISRMTQKMQGETLDTAVILNKVVQPLERGVVKKESAWSNFLAEFEFPFKDAINKFAKTVLHKN